MKPEQEQLPNWEDVPPTLEQLIECVRREVGYRRMVYVRRVARKTMSQELADKQIRLMEYVLKNLENQRRDQCEHLWAARVGANGLAEGYCVRCGAKK